MATSTCDRCGFDASRWSDDDVERTLAHADDLIGYALAGAPESVLGSPAQGDADDPIAAVHAVMHHLDDLAVRRRSTEQFQPMTGTVASLQASNGGVPKLAIAEAHVDAGGLVGDVQNTRRHHGRPWQALCLYSSELLDALVAEGHPIGAGAAGENITIGGIDWGRLRGGLTITIGDVSLRTSSPAAPCRTIGHCFVERNWDRIDHAARPGWSRWYASVVAGGFIRTGDVVTVTA
jgi:MOSC domain-containing protein YiiM